ncbi:hypothetical protein [Nitratireductor sp. GCM10026969]|uniref:hypothetical protein n=1 Tax=Nitratireductor sp. GCM10026969 TaxID=3252645 RepID=UPI00361185A4
MDEENPLVTEALNRFEALLKNAPEPALEGPFAPPPWPRAEMDVMHRMLAGEMGLPERCPDRRCRRSGRCRGGIGDKPGACADLWDDAGNERLRAACLALVLGWMTEIRRLCRREDMLLPPDIPAGIETPDENMPQCRW